MAAAAAAAHAEVAAGDLIGVGRVGGAQGVATMVSCGDVLAAASTGVGLVGWGGESAMAMAATAVNAIVATAGVVRAGGGARLWK